MDRRSFFTAGVAATAAAGVIATMANSASAAATTTASMTTVLDFGAKGDGSTDDGPAFNKALVWAAQNGRVVIVPAGTYAIATPIFWSSTGNVTTLWGLEGFGATLVSKLYGGQDLMKLQSNHTVRYFKLTGISFAGNGSEGHGVHLFCDNGGIYFYNNLIDNISVENVSQNALYFEGNVFETGVTNSYFQDSYNGAVFACSQDGGVCSAINVINCYFNQNKNFGLVATIVGAQYGGTTDVRVYGGYCRDNQSYGMYFNNGMGGGGALIQVGFENNCHNVQPGDPTGCHVWGQGSMRLTNCTGYNQTGGATYLLGGYFAALSTLDNCTQGAGAAMAAAGPPKLVLVYGPSNSLVMVRTSIGQIDVKAGNSCPWLASNCQGASPSGMMTLTNTLNG